VGHSHEEHHDTTPLGLVDVIAGTVVFLLLSWVAVYLAGPDGFGFLKNLLTVERSFELVCSGLIFLGVWYLIGSVLARPYLEAFYLREEKTSGVLARNVELKKEIERLNLEIVSELRTARLEGVKRRDERAGEAKNKAQEIIAEGRELGEREWEKLSEELAVLRKSVFNGIGNEVGELTSTLYRKVVPDASAKGLMH
jgi:F0F1-type ATP synthase membrane subunit b/b'